MHIYVLFWRLASLNVDMVGLIDITYHRLAFLDRRDVRFLYRSRHF